MNPRGNTLVVHVVSARNLYIRAQKALDVYVSLSTSGKGPWKSKVITNTVRVEADCNARGDPTAWDEHCEFQLNDTDTKLVVHVNHKTLLGTTETLGELSVALDAMARFQPPVWFALSKPGTGIGVNGGDRGQIQLGYQFNVSNSATTSASRMSATSVSSLSLNKIEKEKKFDRLRRKMQQFGRGGGNSKRASAVDDSQSLASVSIGAGVYSGSRRSSSLSSTTNSAALAFSSPTPSEQQQNGDRIPITARVDDNNHHGHGHLQLQQHHRLQEDTLSVHSSATTDFDSQQLNKPNNAAVNPSLRSSDGKAPPFSNVVFGTARSARLGVVAGGSCVPVVAPMAMFQQQQQSLLHPQASSAKAPVAVDVAPGDYERRHSVGAQSNVSSVASSSVNVSQRSQHEPTFATPAMPQPSNLKAKVRQKAEQLLLLRGSTASGNKKQPQVTIDDFDSQRGGGTNRNSSRRGSMESSSGFASLGSGQLDTLNENTSPEYLLNVIKHLRTELLKKEERIRDLEQYTDKLVNKVIVSNPELLQASPKPTLRR